MRMARQPIYNIISKTVLLEEMLCRPPDCTIKEWLSTNDPHILWQREYKAILEAIEHQNCKPININVTMSSLPRLIENPALTWSGGVELVEWGTSKIPVTEMREHIQKLQSRGLTVWADDVTQETLNYWIRSGVSGIKVEIDELNDSLFIKRLKETKKAIIIERIEDKREEKIMLEHGFHLGQGYLYGRPTI